MNLLMDSFWYGFVFGMMAGGFLGLLLAGLLRYASDAEVRMIKHVRESDKTSEYIDEHSTK